MFQTLVDAPCPELASAMGFQEKKAKDLQETLQGVLDRREEERQSKELLQLYLKAVDKKGQEDESSQGGTAVTLCDCLHFTAVSAKCFVISLSLSLSAVSELFQYCFLKPHFFYIAEHWPLYTLSFQLFKTEY